MVSYHLKAYYFVCLQFVNVYPHLSKTIFILSIILPSSESATAVKLSTSSLCNCSPAHMGKTSTFTMTATNPPMAIEYRRSMEVLIGVPIR